MKLVLILTNRTKFQKDVFKINVILSAEELFSDNLHFHSITHEYNLQF